MRKLATQKMEDILRAARISSKDVVEKICGEGGDSTRVYLALYATCNTIRKVSYQELAYVLSDAEEVPGLLSVGHRAIGALDKNVNLCAVEFLYGCLEEKSEYQEQLIVTLSHALNSGYPAVRDKAILFLETAFDELSPEQQKQLMGAVHDTEFDKYVLWQDGEAICYPENMIEITLARKKSDLTMEQVNAIKTRAECSAENMYNILQSTLRKQLPVRFLTVALNYDESFIRETAVRLLFEYHAKELDVRKYLNEFVDCGVICQMFLDSAYTR